MVRDDLQMAYCILRKMRKVAHWMCHAQYMRKICARFYFNPQYLHKIVLISQCAIYTQNLRKLYLCAIYAQDLRKIALISPMRNIWARFAQDCTYFLNAQYMRKVCARLYLFLQCTIYVQNCIYFTNAQYMHKICARLYLTSKLKC